jgi:hypothetical protein
LGVEPILGAVWLAALVAGAILFWRAIGRRQWLVALGTIAGVLMGLLPLLLWRGQAIALLAMVLLALPAAVVLAASYAFRQRTGPAIAAVLFAVLPIAFALVPKAASSNTRISGSGSDKMFVAFGELVMLASPLLCMLACREFAKIFDRRARLEAV